MMTIEEETAIQKYYRNKTIFLTGGTGFLGKAYIEKLLRTTQVDCIYILVRPKRGKCIAERVKDIFSDPLFEQLHKLKPHAVKRVIAISGDCLLTNLGISDNDRKLLVRDVQLVVHSAATVRFNEPLNCAIAINVRATRDILQLAREMQKLESFVHVSTAFSNCAMPHIEERFYNNNLEITSEYICKANELLNAHMFNQLTNEFIKDFPNTYTFSKALGEDATLRYGNDLPLCVLRPGIVMPTLNDPVQGWIDNMYGPISVMLGASWGVLRVMYLDTKKRATIVPVDICANVMITCGWKNAQRFAEELRTRSGSLNPPPIYNLVPEDDNPITWNVFKTTVERHGSKIPLPNMIWYPFLIATTSKLFFQLLWFIYHTLPGYIIDALLTLTGKKRRLTKLYKKVKSQIGVIEYFSIREWTFSVDNVRQLLSELSADDKRLYDFNMRNLNWAEYFYNSLHGMRIYLCNQQPETIPQSLILYKRFKFIHRTVQAIACGLVTSFIYSFVIKLT